MMLRGTRKSGFTIVELLTVMSIIIILMSVLVPAMSKIRIYAKVVTQKGQFSDMSKGLEIYRNEHQDTFPDSGPADTDPLGPFGYCGAMKLCEALMGQDGMGFNPSSRFLASGFGKNPAGGADIDIYPFDLCTQTDPTDYDEAGNVDEKRRMDSLRERTKYVDPENFKAYRLQDAYKWLINAGVSFRLPTVTFLQPPSDTFPYTVPNAVIGDVFLRATNNCTGQKIGMPVLYYKADPAKLHHDVNDQLIAGNPNMNIYNFDDNYAITALGCPWESAANVNPHPMFTDPLIFLKEITNTRVTSTPRPHNEDSYILMSAGYDGLYGTKDDVFNFAD